MKLHFLGADDGVTGSRHLVDSAGSHILLDDGLLQGWKSHRKRNWVFPDAPTRSARSRCWCWCWCWCRWSGDSGAGAGTVAVAGALVVALH